MASTMLLSACLLLAVCITVGASDVRDMERMAECAAPKPLGAATFYLDAERGDDANPGTSAERAWRTLDRAGRAALGPGCRLLLAGGQTFHGTLALTKDDGGSPSAPVTIASYGQGRATIDAGAGDGLTLTDCAHVTIHDLDIAGCGRKNGSDGAGVRLLRTHGVTLDRLDVRGFRLGGVVTGGDADTRITHIHAHDNGFAGITTYGGYGDVPRSRNLYIADCLADNNPGDPKNLTNHSGNGIVVGGVDGCLIEYCEATNNGWDMPRQGNGPVGIWGWNCDRLTIQHCVSHGNRSPGEDGGGFDFDGGVTNSVMQYNLSYGNQGTGYLLCQFPGASVWKNNIVRYNISLDDGSKNFQSGIGLWIGGEGISDALVYNNTIVGLKHAVASRGDLPGFVYRNNVFVGGGDLLFGPFTKSRLENNLYWRTGEGDFYRDGDLALATMETWARGTGQETVGGERVGRFADPRLAMPGAGDRLPTNPRALAAMRLFYPRPDSPCVGAGTIIRDNGGRDFYGRLVPSTRPPALGACEPPDALNRRR